MYHFCFVLFFNFVHRLVLIQAKKTHTHTPTHKDPSESEGGYAIVCSFASVLSILSALILAWVSWKNSVLNKFDTDAIFNPPSNYNCNNDESICISRDTSIVGANYMFMFGLPLVTIMLSFLWNGCAHCCCSDDDDDDVEDGQDERQGVHRGQGQGQAQEGQRQGNKEIADSQYVTQSTAQYTQVNTPTTTTVTSDKSEVSVPQSPNNNNNNISENTQLLKQPKKDKKKGKENKESMGDSKYGNKKENAKKKDGHSGNSLSFTKKFKQKQNSAQQLEMMNLELETEKERDASSNYKENNNESEKEETEQQQQQQMKKEKGKKQNMDSKFNTPRSGIAVSPDSMQGNRMDSIDGSHINYDSANEFVGDDVSVSGKKFYGKKKDKEKKKKDRKRKTTDTTFKNIKMGDRNVPPTQPLKVGAFVCVCVCVYVCVCVCVFEFSKKKEN